MPTPTNSPVTIDDYLGSFPDDRRGVLEQVRAAIHRGMPGADETVRYGMPAVMIGRRYGLHFAGWKGHIGLYPVPVLDPELEREIAPYRAAKDTVRLRWNRPVPYELIERVSAAIVRLRENE